MTDSSAWWYHQIEALADEALIRCESYPEHPHWEAWKSYELDLRDLLEVKDQDTSLSSVKAVAWDEGHEAGLLDYDDRMPDHTPNPYRNTYDKDTDDD